MSDTAGDEFMQDVLQDGYVLTADPKRVDFARVHRWLSEESYWAAGCSYDLVARSIEGSLPYSVFAPVATAGSPATAPASSSGLPATAPASSSGLPATAPASSSGLPATAPNGGDAPDEAGSPGVEQVAFARVVTDGATFAWICDVFVGQEHRGRGLGKWMIDSIVADLSGRGIQRFLLATKDAHEVYRRSGFAELEGAQRFMEIDRRPARNAILGQI